MLHKQQRYLGQVLTDPTKERPIPMTCKKFLLRGIATSVDNVFVCRREPAKLVEVDDTPAARDQWWRLALVPNESEPVKAEVCRLKLFFAPDVFTLLTAV